MRRKLRRLCSTMGMSSARGFRHLSPATLDKLALLAGFQSWKDLRRTLRGETAADVNYED